MRHLGFTLFAVWSLTAALAFAGDRPGRAAIATAHELATGVGADILEKGGNAFDAAVAVSAALAVVEPESSGIGGGGFWLLYRAADEHAVMVDGRETAPGQAHADMYLDDAGAVDRDLAINGPLAAGIPGAPAAQEHIAANWGSLPLDELLAPAIRLAEDGFPVDAKYQTLINFRAPVLQRWPETAAIFMPSGKVPALGDIIRQPDLARTLRSIAEHGAEVFYRGKLTDQMIRGSRSRRDLDPRGL